MAKLLRETFDRDRDFIVQRALTFSGKSLGPGDSFDKSKATTRRLRQLYEGRVLNMAPMSNGHDYVAPDGPPDFASLPQEAIVDWLTTHGVTPRYGTAKSNLITRAEQVWLDQQTG